MAKKYTKRYRKKILTEDTAFRVISDEAGIDTAMDGAVAEGVALEERDEAYQNGNGKKTQAGKVRQKSKKDFLYLPTDVRSLFPTEIFKSATLPYRLVHRQWRRELPHLFAVFFLVLLLYAFTTPHKVTLEDDGLFIANLKYFGVAHPPGYPMHTFLGGLFYHLLPFGTPAFKGHFFSGFVGAIACAAIYATTVMLVQGRLFGYLAGLAYGASKTFWSQAIITEVYTLNAMFFFIVLALCVWYSSQAGRSGMVHRRLLCIIAFFYGLGMASHYPILFLGSTGLGLLVWSQLKSNILPNLPKAFVMLMLGAVPPYLWMVWRSHDLTPANFYGPISDLEGFKFYVLRSGYSGVDKQQGVGWEDKLIFARSLGDDMLWQFTPFGFCFVVIGVLVMLRSRFNWLCLSLLVSWFTSSVLLIYLLDFKSTFIWLAAFRVYHLLAFGIMAIWLAFGAAWGVDKLKRFMPFIVRQQFALVIVLGVVGGSVFSHWEVNNRRDYTWAHDLAIAKLNSVEQNAILFTFDDLDLPVGYLHYVEDLRPDLTVYNDQALVYGNRLYSPFVPDEAPATAPNSQNKKAILQQFIAETERPIYYHPQRRYLYESAKYGSDLNGFLRRVNREGPFERVILSDALRLWLDQNIGLLPTDLWTRQQHYSTVSQLVNVILVAESNGFKLDESWMEVVDRAREKNVLVRLLYSLQKIHQMDEEALKRELAWTERLDVDKEELLDKAMKSRFFVLRADLMWRLTDMAAAAALTEKYGEDEEGYKTALAEDMQERSKQKNEAYEQALKEGLSHGGASPINPALFPLLNYYYRTEQFCPFIRLSEAAYKQTKDMPTELLRNLRRARKDADCSLVGDASGY